MSNEVYQRLLRVSPAQLRDWLPKTSRYPRDMTRLIGRWSDDDLQESFRNLGGHDFSMLREAFAQADLESGPNVVFAYTLKGWRLPSIGDPQNHSVVLSPHQMEQFRSQLDVSPGTEWDRMPPDSAAGRLCSDTSRVLGISRKPRYDIPEMHIPADFGQRYTGNMATQQTFGLILTAISRNLPDVTDRVVTVSPDVASSTNLGGWINKVGVWHEEEKEPMPEESIVRALRWEEHARGQHIELGISENNLFMMLGQLGLSFETNGEMLFPYRDAVRSVREAGPGRFRLQRVFGRQVHRGGHAVGDIALAGGRGAPVDDHAFDRRRDAGDRLLRAVLRSGA